MVRDELKAILHNVNLIPDVCNIVRLFPDENFLEKILMLNSTVNEVENDGKQFYFAESLMRK